VILRHHVEEGKRIEAELRKSKEDLQIITDSMSAPVTRCRRDLTYAWASRPYAEWLGLPPESIVGRPIAEVLGPEAFQQLRPHFEAVLSGRAVDYEEQVNFQGLGRRWINAIYTPTRDASGAVDGWVAVVIDIHDRKQYEEVLRHADRRKDEFLAVLAHELRSPLAPIRNAVEILKSDGVPEAERRWGRDVIDRQSRTLARLLDDLLDVSRISSGKLVLRTSEILLADVIAQAVETSRVAERGHAFSSSLPDAPVTIEGDPVRLAQVFSNLLDNAAKYTDPGGAIRVSARMNGEEIEISVKDSGIGIPPERLPDIFGLYAQAHSPEGRPTGGLGIGLALVRGLVQLHGGSVEARSAGAGTGSEFLVRLPVRAALPATRAEPPSEAATAAQPRHILVVDDSADAVESLAILLRCMGHRVDVARDGVEAVQAAGELRPDLVLLDIGMPRMNGYEAARRIRGEPWGQHMALVALTGWGQPEDKRLALESGCDRHLTKPVDPAILENLLALLPPSRRPDVASAS
jgi:PAS domain S-box-containing protein